MNVSLSSPGSPNFSPIQEIQTGEIILGNKKFRTPAKGFEVHTPMKGTRKPPRLNLQDELQDAFSEKAVLLGIYMRFKDEELLKFTAKQKEELADLMNVFFANYDLENGDLDYQELYDSVITRFQEGGPLENYFV